MKRLDELTGIYSRRVVSGPLRVTGCVLSDRDTPQGNPGAKNRPVTLAHSEREGSLRMLFFRYPGSVSMKPERTKMPGSIAAYAVSCRHCRMNLARIVIPTEKAQTEAFRANEEMNAERI